MATKRLRIFAGPNGSGKSTIYKNLITKGDVNFGIFVNADEIEKLLVTSGRLDFASYGLSLDLDSFVSAYKNSTFYELSGGSKIEKRLLIDYDCLLVNDKALVNSYFTAFVADFIRVAMLDYVNVFTVETVMSHPSKLDYIKLAKSKGYRVYLYFVSTRDAQINISRVEQRVNTGGHNVPIPKIASRYTKSLENLYAAVSLSSRAYLFDNSERDKPMWYAEYDGEQLSLRYATVPSWLNDYLIKPILAVK